ncbi:MAG: gliding motility-associated C-terminal domain-containing protein [Bacteroidales bacterium]|nr:gliding motility-associated C-terminal domain-containing protein [Bacteroidales bacterium]
MNRIAQTISRAATSLIIAIMLMPIQPGYAQEVSTMGVDFWMAYPSCYEGSGESSNTFKLFFSGKRSCVVTVNIPRVSYTQTINISPNTTSTITLPTASAHSHSSGSISNNGIHITSTDTVSAYGSYQYTHSYDVTNILPTDALSDQYTVITHQCVQFPAHFIVVATEDNTTFSYTLNGDAMSSTNSVVPSGTTVNVTLQYAGQCYQLKSTTPGNLCGTTIQAEDCKKIAVFAGNECLYLPNYDNSMQAAAQSCDMAFNQMIPTKYWGKEFPIVYSGLHRPDQVLVYPSEDGTIVVDGNTPINLTAGNFYTFHASNNNAASYVTTTCPSSVYLYYQSEPRIQDGIDVTYDGDPAMVPVNPNTMMMHNVTFGSFNSTYTHSHMANIVTPTGETSLITLDGNSIANQFSAIPNSPYSWARVSVSAGSHNLISTGQEGFCATIFGQGQWEGYGYSAGCELRDLSKLIMLDNDIVGPTDTLEICAGSTHSFQFETDRNHTSCTWYFEDGVSIAADSTSHYFANAGTYHIMCVVDFEQATPCSNGLTDTLWTTIHAVTGSVTEQHDTINENQLPWVIGGVTYYTDFGPDTIRLGGLPGCDSLLIASLRVIRNIPVYFDTTICGNNLPIIWHGHTFSTPDTVADSLTSVMGGDSIVYYILDTVARATYDTIDDHFCEGDSYHILGTVFTLPGTYTLQTTTSLGCDSIVTLNLTENQTGESTLDTFTCEGTPLMYNDQIYSNSGTYITTLLTTMGCDSLVTINLDTKPNYYVELYDTLRDGHSIIFDGAQIQEPGFYSTLYTTIFGCDSNIVLYVSADPGVIWFPNIITPDLANNRFFKAYGHNIIELEIFIFNRWGENIKVLHGLDDYWDGTYKGHPCPEAAYAYIAKFRTVDIPNAFQTAKGTVTIIR